MPNVRKADLAPVPVAVLCGDIHLSDDVPAARAETRDEWYKVQDDAIFQVQKICVDHSPDWGGILPLIVAGDFFHKNDNPPQLVNNAMQWFAPFSSGCYGIPGNHDLPNGNPDRAINSSYQTLVVSEVVTDLTAHDSLALRRFNREVVAHGFGFGSRKKPRVRQTGRAADAMNVAVIHRYVWQDGHQHPNAKDEDHVERVAEEFKEFDLVVAGDNHSGFYWKPTGDSLLPRVFVNGCLTRRRRNEIPYAPMVGILYSDGSVKRKKLDCSKDRFVAEGDETTGIVEKAEALGVDAEELIGLLRGNAGRAVAFKDAVAAWLRKNPVGAAVQELILRCLERPRGENSR